MLINAPNASGAAGTGNIAAFPGMAAVTLATRLQRDFGNKLDIRVSDGGIKTAKQIAREISEFRPHAVGIGVLTPTYLEGLKLAQYAYKRHHSRVILGNDHAGFQSEHILNRYDFVDAVAEAEYGEAVISTAVAITTRVKPLGKIDYGSWHFDIGTLNAFLEKTGVLKRLFAETNSSPADRWHLDSGLDTFGFRSSEVTFRKENSRQRWSCTIDGTACFARLLTADHDWRHPVFRYVYPIYFLKPCHSDLYSGESDIPNLDFIKADLPAYSANYNARYGKFHKAPRIPIIVNNVRGCPKFKAPCTYCSIFDLSLRQGAPEFHWKTVEHYNQKYGVNFFFEVGDNFLAFPNYIERLIATRPFDLKAHDIEMEVYGYSRPIARSDRPIQWFGELNVTRVNMGLDSGDDKMLLLLGKGCTVQDNYDAVRRLAAAGISIHASFPLGMLGETPDSLGNTLRFVERISSDFSQTV